MNGYKALALAAMAAVAFAVATPRSEAQISISIGAAPTCPYGYYDYAPYRCSPRGYYGPQYFNGGAFIGVGPWFHGSDDFHGTVNNRFDPQHGYHGAMPKQGQKPGKSKGNFQGNEERDGRGHASGGR